MSETPRVRTHGDQMDTLTPMQGEAIAAVPVHCCECWRYTDDMRRDGDLIHEAVTLIANGDKLAVENSAAFKAADAFLAATFHAAAPPRTALLPKF